VLPLITWLGAPLCGDRSIGTSMVRHMGSTSSAVGDMETRMNGAAPVGGSAPSTSAALTRRPLVPWYPVPLASAPLVNTSRLRLV